jgi:ATP/maltotriose-dependent transcriptional regulator MalT
MVASLVPSGRGQWDRAEELLLHATHWARANGRYFEPYVLIGEAILAQAKGNYHGMLHALAPLAQTPDQGVSLRLHAWWRPLYVEALVGSGKLDEAANGITALRRLSHGAHPHLRISTAWLSGWLAHCQGDLAQARTHYEESLALTATGQKLPLRQALLEEAYGRLLSDQPGQQDQALNWLHQAHHHFTQLGAAPFAARCTSDLTSAGAPRPAPRTFITELTDRERDIAHLVSQGLTNKEVGRDLFISTKTVEYHLGNIYAKLDLTNRRQLRDRIKRQATPAY